MVIRRGSIGASSVDLFASYLLSIIAACQANHKGTFDTFIT